MKPCSVWAFRGFGGFCRRRNAAAVPEKRFRFLTPIPDRWDSDPARFRSPACKDNHAAGHRERKDDTQMMFTGSSPFSDNLDEFDSIRSVLLYRSDTTLASHFNSACLFVSLCALQTPRVGLFLNTGADLKTSWEVEITKHRNKHSCAHVWLTFLYTLPIQLWAYFILNTSFLFKPRYGAEDWKLLRCQGQLWRRPIR